MGVIMGTGIGEYCKCCGNQLNYDDGFDFKSKLCNECKNVTIPMVLHYLSQNEGWKCG